MNIYNNYILDKEKSHVLQELTINNSFFIKVCIGIVPNFFIESYLLTSILNCEVCRTFLKLALPDLLEYVPARHHASFGSTLEWLHGSKVMTSQVTGFKFLYFFGNI